MILAAASRLDFSSTEGADLCISDADVLTPLHNNNMTPVRATHSRNRVRVINTHIALVGGSCAFADFHVTPPLGSNMPGEPPLGQLLQPRCAAELEGVEGAEDGGSWIADSMARGGDTSVGVDGGRMTFRREQVKLKKLRCAMLMAGVERQGK
ncbi:hypothetical protein HYFRA_00003320 [Hymenoscyphus fraxineus]|uniref:Uncharacterized protein n=1 Tax=Hymenoscyphus fraxineus TaxID=746836 RepID=A0A9N9PT50_9HELO|nr:hypothetical protein HYFRA_00003320 [Hymenoscyphus fraxineus]